MLRFPALYSPPPAPFLLACRTDKSGAPFACCDLAPQGPLDTDWAKKVSTAPGAKKCQTTEGDDDDHSAHSAHSAHSTHTRRFLL